MDYEHVSTGTVRLGGTADFVVVNNYIVTYSIGSVVYLRAKAMRGILKKVAIKNVFLFPSKINAFSAGLAGKCNFNPLYLDTWNSYHNERDLCGYEEAVALAEEYLESYAQRLENAALNGL
jgi:hypothetical protein